MSWLWGAASNAMAGRSVASLWSALNKTAVGDEQALELISALRDKSEQGDVRDALGKGLHIACAKQTLHVDTFYFNSLFHSIFFS